MQFYLESDLTSLTPEKLNAGEYCKPEQEVSHSFSDQWEDALRTQYSLTIDARQGVEPTNQIKADTKERRDDDEVTAAFMTDDGSRSDDPEIKDTIGDKDKLENRSNIEATVTTLASNEVKMIPQKIPLKIRMQIITSARIPLRIN